MKIAILGAGHGGLAMSADLKLMGHLLQVGFVFILYSISYLITSLISSKLSSKIEPYKLCIFSMFVPVLNILLFIYTSSTASLLPTEIFLIVCGISFSFFITSNNNYVMSMSKTTNAGMIAGIHRMTGRLGMLWV